jgi:hypothetical protein
MLWTVEGLQFGEYKMSGTPHEEIDYKTAINISSERPAAQRTL